MASTVKPGQDLGHGTQSWVKSHMLSTLQPVLEQIKELQADIQRLGRSASAADARIDGAEAKATERHQDLLELRTGVAQTGAQFERLQAELTKASRERYRLETDHEVTKKDLGKTLEHARTSGATLEATQQHVAALDAEVRALRSEVAHKHRGLNEHVDRMDRLKELCEALNVRHVDMIRDLGNVTRSSAETERAFRAFAKQHEEAESGRKDEAARVREALWLKEHVLQLQRELSASQQGVAAHLNDFQALEDKVEMLQDGLDTERRKELDRKLDELHADYDDTRSTVQQIGIRLVEVEKSTSQLQTGISERKSAHASLLETLNEEIQRFRAQEKQQAHANGELRKEFSSLNKRFDHFAQSLESLNQAAGKHASMPNRLDYLEKSVGINTARIERHQKDLQEAREMWENRIGRGQPQEVQSSTFGPSELELRVDALEKASQGVADAAGEQVAALRAELEALRGHGDSSQASLRGPHHLTLECVMEKMEHAIHDASRKHAAEISALEQAHNALSAKHDAAHTRHARDLEVLKASHEGHAAVVKTLRDMEAANSDAYCRQGGELTRAQEKLDMLASRCSALEAAGASVVQLKQAHDRLASEHRALESRHGSVQDRAQALEEKVRDIVHDQTKEAELNRTRIGRLQGVLDDYERSRGAPGDLERAMAAEREAVDERVRGAQVHCDALRGRLDYMEGALGASIEEHRRKLDSLQGEHAKLAQAASEGFAAGDASPMRRVSSAGASGGQSWGDWVAELASKHAEIASKHEELTRAVEEHELSNVKLVGEVEAHKARSLASTSRLDSLEKLVGDTTGSHAEALASSKTRLEELQGRLNTGEAERQRLSSSLDGLKRSVTEMAGDGSNLEARYTSLADRLAKLEACSGDSAEKQEKELDGVRAASARLASQVKEQEALCDSLTSRLANVANSVEQTVNDSMGKHSSIQDRFTKLESDVSSLIVKHAQGMDALKAADASLSEEAAELRRTCGAQLARVDVAERRVEELAERHARDAGEVQTRLDQLGSRITEEHSREDGLEERLKALEASDARLREVEVHNGVLHDKVGMLEGRHDGELGEMREQIKSLRQRHQGDVAEARKSNAEALKESAASMMKQLEKEQRARESHERAVQETFAKEREAKARQDEMVQELITLERDAREKQREQHHEHLQRESVAREVAHKDLHELVGKEKALRELHLEAQKELLHGERSARQEAMDKLLTLVQSTDGKCAALVPRLTALEAEQKRQQEQLMKAEVYLGALSQTGNKEKENSLEQDVRGMQHWQREVATKLELQGVQVKKAQDDLHKAMADCRSASVGLSELRQEVVATNVSVSKLDLRYDACHKHLQGLLGGMQDTQRHILSGEHGPWGVKTLDSVLAAAHASPKTPRLPSLPPAGVGQPKRGVAAMYMPEDSPFDRTAWWRVGFALSDLYRL